MVYFNTKSSWISVGEKKTTTNGMGGHFWSSTSKGKKSTGEWRHGVKRESDKGISIFFFIIVMENDVLIPKRAAALVGFVSCGKFSNLLCCLASVWKRADSTHHLKGHNDDSKLFYFPSKFFFFFLTAFEFFFFHFMFFIYFYYWRRRRKKIINNKESGPSPLRAFPRCQKKREKKCVSLSSSFFFFSTRLRLGTYSSSTWCPNSWRRPCLITILILILFWMEMVRARCRVPPYRDRAVSFFLDRLCCWAAPLALFSGIFIATVLNFPLSRATRLTFKCFFFLSFCLSLHIHFSLFLFVFFLSSFFFFSRFGIRLCARR